MTVLGHIATPPLEIVATRDRAVTDARFVELGATPRRLWARLFRGARRHTYLVGKGAGAHAQVDPAALGGRDCFALLEHIGDRPCVNLIEGMQGHIEIGVCRVRVEQLLADPALRHPAGHTQYPLPNGVRATLHVGDTQFELSLGAGKLDSGARESATELVLA